MFNEVKIAVDKNFTRGRRTTHVAAACLYIACRYVVLIYFIDEIIKTGIWFVVPLF
jgi:transcription factor IIIB 90 kDa subunit